jgi:hypothetical protein
MAAQLNFDPNVFGPFTSLFQVYFSNLEAGPQGLGPLKAIARCQLEVMGLMSRRAQALMEIPSRLGQCRTPQDLLNEQMRFWRTAGEQCAESSRRIIEASGQMALAPLGTRGEADSRRERDYINFSDPKDANGQDGGHRMRQQRRVA